MHLRTRRFSAVLYLAPALVLIALFVYYPLVANIGFGFFRFTAGGTDLRFVGLANYARLFDDPVILTALGNNTLYAVVSVLFQVFGGLVVAAWLTRTVGRRLGAFLRSVYFLPAVISMTETLASEWGPLNITVNAIAPGAVSTEGANKRLWAEDDTMAQIAKRIPLGQRMGTAEDCVGAVLFLASDAASFITGACVPVDAGMTVMGPS